MGLMIQTREEEMTAPPVPSPRPSLEYLPAAQLGVDPAYQRPLSSPKVTQLARDWDDLACGALIVSRRRPEEGVVLPTAEEIAVTVKGDHLLARRRSPNVVVDGQTRLAAFRQTHAATDELPCLVYVGLSQADEAALFIRCNSIRSAPVALHAFHARQLIGEVQAANITALVQSHGLRIHAPAYYGPAPDNTLQSVASLDKLYDVLGAVGLHRVLGILVDAWDGDTISLRGYFLLGIGHFCKTYLDVEIDDAHLAEVLGAESPTIRLNEARGLSYQLGGSTWFNLARVALRAYNHGRLGKSRLADRMERVTRWTRPLPGETAAS